MIRITKWTTLLLKLLPISIGFAAAAEVLNILYLQQVISSGVDPTSDAGTTPWQFLLIFGVASLVNGGLVIWVLIAQMGFMLRAGQWIKALAPSEFEIRPGWGIWGWIAPFISYFMPFRILKLISNAGRRSELEQPKIRGMLIRYWVIEVTSIILGNVQFRLTIKGDTSYEAVMADSILEVAVCALDLLAFVALIPLVKALVAGLKNREDETSVSASD